MSLDDDTIEAFSQHLRDEGRADSTIRVYTSDVAGAFEYDDPVAKVRDRQLAPKTRRRVQSALKSFARFQEDGDLLIRLQRVRMPPAKRVNPKRALERSDWDALLDAIDEADVDEPVRASLGLIGCRGMRVGDVVRMPKAAVVKGLKAKAIVFRAKGEHYLEYTVTSAMEPHLRSLLEYDRWERVCDLVSPRAHRDTRTEAARLRVSRTLRRVGAAAGLSPDELHLHRLRRTYAWHFLQAVKGDLVALQQHMGWLSLDTAKEYVDQDRRKELDAAAERMLSKR